MHRNGNDCVLYARQKLVEHRSESKYDSKCNQKINYMLCVYRVLTNSVSINSFRNFLQTEIRKIRLVHKIRCRRFIENVYDINFWAVNSKFLLLSLSLATHICNNSDFHIQEKSINAVCKARTQFVTF